MPKILIIDDKHDNLVAVSALLKAMIPVCRTIVADSGPKGLQTADLEQPDTILLDILMPDMDGFEVCRRLKNDERTRHIPVIMLTAIRTDAQSRIKGLETGADAFLSKPIDESELAAQVNVMLRIKKAEDNLRAEKASLQADVREQTQLNQTLLDALPYMAFLIEKASYRIVASNQAARQLGAIVGKPCYSVWGQQKTPCHWCRAPELWETDTPQHLEIEIGDRVWDTHWHPLNQELFLHYAFDITAQKKIQQDLQQAQKMEAIGTLAGGIAHDFNNILSIVIGNIELALDDVPAGDSAGDCLKEAKIAAFRGRELIKQILNFSRSSAMEKEPVAIAPLVKEAFSLLRSSIPTTVKFTRSIPDLPDVILANPTQINQILMNLCANAVDAMNQVGTLYITLSREYIGPWQSRIFGDLAPGAYVKIAVSDTGCGMDPKTLSRIYDPYFTTKGVGRGTGMGLAIVYGIVRDCKGAVTVKSDVGRGTAFHIYLPCIEQSVKHESEAAEVTPGGSESILFVDDEEPQVKMAARILSLLGYKVEGHTSPLTALAAFQTGPRQFDLVITDATMPDMPGPVFAQNLIHTRPDIPIIMCTGHSDLIDADQAAGLGIRRFLMKPVTRHQMGTAIREVLDQDAS